MKKIVALLLCLCMLPVYALAADTDWLIGVWTAVSATQDGENMPLDEFLDEGGIAMLVIREDGALVAVEIEGDGEIDANDFSWEPQGDTAISEGILLYQKNDGALCATMDGMSMTLRRATSAEIDRIAGFVKLPRGCEVKPAESLWFLGAWEYLYSVNEGETDKSSILEQPGDWARVIFKENNVYTADTCVGGQTHREDLSWKIEDGMIYAGTSVVALLSDGTMKVNESGDVMYFRHAEGNAVPTRREMDATVSEQTITNGVIAAPVTGPALSLIPLPEELGRVYEASPSGRYLLSARLVTQHQLYDTQTGTTLPITFNAQRSAAVEGISMDVLASKLNSSLRLVAWSADEHYAALLFNASSKDASLGDLYVLDTQTGEIFVPASWSKVMEEENYGVVQDVAFAPDGTLYFLLETSRKGNTGYLAGPAMLYACSMDTHATTLIKELPGKRNIYPSLTVAADGTVLVAVREEDNTFTLLAGAQHDDMDRIAIPQITGAIVHENGKLALMVQDTSTGAYTCTLLDMNKPVPAQLTGLVFSTTGVVSQLPVLTKNYTEVLGGRMIYERWRDIRRGLQEGRYAVPNAAAFSPDGTKLMVACTNFNLFVVDLATLQAQSVALTDTYPKAPTGIYWADDDTIIVKDIASTQLFKLEGLE